MARLSVSLINKYLDSKFAKRLIEVSQQAEKVCEHINQEVRHTKDKDRIKSLLNIEDYVNPLLLDSSNGISLPRYRTLRYVGVGDYTRDIVDDLRGNVRHVLASLWYLYSVYEHELHDMMDSQDAADMREVKKLKMCLDILDRISPRLSLLASAHNE